MGNVSEVFGVCGELAEQGPGLFDVAEAFLGVMFFGGSLG